MEMEIEKFKAQKDLVGERCRAEELQAALAEALAENEQLHERVRALESRTPLASDPDTPRSRAETAEADAQTDDHPWDRLFADANRAVLESKLLRFGNAAMYQQMLENNDEFRKAFEEVADELRQEKENNAVLMSMQEELMADLQNTYDGQAQEGEDGVQAEEDAHNGEDVPADAQGYETDDGRVAPPQELQDTPRPRFSP
ncbi:hypothetical protein DFJ74DRAFT_681346 [Hyaloraphidium curvatum]|nr:hypothetical protein DFJ74DRAFT_681346 [Hyaloraphidium curvatum]